MFLSGANLRRAEPLFIASEALKDVEKPD